MIHYFNNPQNWGKFIFFNNREFKFKPLVLLLIIFLIKKNLTFLFISAFYIIFILYFYFYILNNKINNNINIKTLSIIKDKEYILFKNILFNFYYSTSIILFIFIFKHNGLNYLFNFNPSFIFLLFLILIVYCILLSDFFNMNLFNFFKEINIFINLLNNLKIKPVNIVNIINKNINLPKAKDLLNNNYIFIGIHQRRNFSTNFINKNISKTENNIINSDLVDIHSDKTDLAFIKAKAIKDFKQIYKDGYLGYSHIFNLGNVSYLINADTVLGFNVFVKNINFKLKQNILMK